jgi:hypothetical protein
MTEHRIHSGRIAAISDGVFAIAIKADNKLPNGTCTLKMDFAYKGKTPGLGGTVTLYVNGKKAGSGKVDETQPGGVLL